jgi:translocator protein
MTDAPLHAPTPPKPGPSLIAAGLMLVVLFAITIAFAVLASAAPSGDESPWFRTLNKPPIFPPSIVFPLVWTPLYLLMPIALFLVWQRTGFGRAFVGPATLWGAQLVLNAAWTWLFFAVERPFWALAEILALLGVIVAMIGAFWRIRPLAGALMVPYAAWVSFAAVLNGWFVAIN